MIFTDDLISFFKLLNEDHVEYMIIGGAAVNIHGFSRSTGDMDIWFNPTQENFERFIPSSRLGLKCLMNFERLNTSEIKG